jgi:hypothetical protein
MTNTTNDFDARLAMTSLIDELIDNAPEWIIARKRWTREQKIEIAKIIPYWDAGVIRDAFDIDISDFKG